MANKIYGCDVSYAQGNFDPTGQGFVIIRVGYGHFKKDTQFENNVRKCIQRGIPFGIYHYSYALNTAEAESEARSVLATIAPYKDKISCGVWFDMEDADGYKARHSFIFDHAHIAPICYTFAKMVEDAGYYSGIYCSESWLGYLKPENNRFDKWVASWGVNNGRENRDTSALGSILQYTSKPFDKDVMYRGFIYKKSGGSVKPAAQPKPVAPAFNVEQAARDVIAGKYGDGDTRKKALGAHYNEVQARVNQILGASKSAAKPAASAPIKAGDRVKVVKAVDYNGRAFKTWYPTYTVMEIKGNRAVIGVSGTVTAAINVANIRKA